MYQSFILWEWVFKMVITGLRVDLADWVDFAYWWSCIGEGLRLPPAQEACFWRSCRFSRGPSCRPCCCIPGSSRSDLRVLQVLLEDHAGGAGDGADKVHMAGFTQDGKWPLLNWFLRVFFVVAVKPLYWWIYFLAFCNLVCVVINTTVWSLSF